MKTIKNQILFTFILLSGTLFGQLKVRPDGTVKIGYASPVPSGGQLEITGTGQTLETKIFNNTADISRLWTMNSAFAYGFGIDGSGLGYIYRNFNSPTATMTFNMSGCVGIGRTPSTSYLLDVNGNIRVNSTVYTSDSLLKRNINSLSSQRDKLNRLHSVSYLLNGSDNERVHYGFLAQEVRLVYPELVYEDDDGLLGIDYVSIIPLLVNEVQHQNKMLDSLNSVITELQRDLNINSISHPQGELGILRQNKPNPFNQRTTITFQINSNVKNAKMLLYNSEGKLVKEFEVIERNESSIIIQGSELNPGIYYYSLELDGQIIDSKQMILTQ